jgi:hypothetical protein
MPGKKLMGLHLESYCGKCKANRVHAIMKMEGGTVAKVRCKICGSLHKFRPPLDEAKVHKSKAIKSIGEEQTAELVWAAGLAEAKGRERDYSMALKYRVGDIVNHQTFGKGIVIKLHTNKCDMLFKDRERLMASTNH